MFPESLKWSNLSPKLFCNINLMISWSPTTFSENVKKSVFDDGLPSTRSSSGWVLMIRKVLSSKSLSSEEHFKYLQCVHIFKTHGYRVPFPKIFLQWSVIIWCIIWVTRWNFYLSFIGLVVIEIIEKKLKKFIAIFL